jgi:hypothetical protein
MDHADPALRPSAGPSLLSRPLAKLVLSGLRLGSGGSVYRAKLALGTYARTRLFEPMPSAESRLILASAWVPAFLMGQRAPPLIRRARTPTRELYVSFVTGSPK